MADRIIGICDDQAEALTLLSEHIVTILPDITADAWDIKTYLSPAKLLEDAGLLDVLFLDIEMPEMDGIETGRKVMNINPKCKIIMATSRIDRFKEAFYIEAVRFITKPFYCEEIKEALTAVFKKQVGEKEIEVFYDRMNYKIKEKDISIVRAFNGYVEITVGNRVFRKDISLHALEAWLDSRLFFRINRQILVHFAYIDEYTHHRIKVGEEHFTIAMRRRKDFLNRYTEYDLNYR